MTHLLSHQLLQIEIPVLGCVPVDAPAWTCLGLQQPSWAGRLSQAESERKRANARPTPPEPAKADAMGQSSPSAPPSDRSLALRAPAAARSHADAKRPLLQCFLYSGFLIFLIEGS